MSLISGALMRFWLHHSRVLAASSSRSCSCLTITYRDFLPWTSDQHASLVPGFPLLQAHGFSQEASFLAAPIVGPHTHVKFLAIADMGQAEVDGSNEESEMIPALNTTRLMIAEADDKQLLIHNGDISYARLGPPLLYCTSVVHPSASRVCLSVCPFCRLSVHTSICLSVVCLCSPFRFSSLHHHIT